MQQDRAVSNKNRNAEVVAQVLRVGCSVNRRMVEQVQRECEELKRQCAEVGSQGERQRAVLRREVRQRTQEVSVRDEMICKLHPPARISSLLPF